MSAVNEFDNSFQLTESIYLQSSFDINPLKVESKHEINEKVIAISNEGVIDPLCVLLCELLATQCDLLLQPINYEVKLLPKLFRISML